MKASWFSFSILLLLLCRGSWGEGVWHYYWEGTGRERCLAVSTRGESPREAPAHRCGEYHRLKVPGGHKVVTYFEGMDALTGAEVIAKLLGSSRLALDSNSLRYYKALLRRYYRGERVSIREFDKTLLAAEVYYDREEDSLLKCRGYGYVGGCSPDTFYSWGPLEKVENVRRNTLARGKAWSGQLNSSKTFLGRSIYLSYSPLASYCYGRHALRFKFSHPPELGPLNNQGIVGTNLEWVVGQDVSMVSSVSFGTPEHFDEMVLEVRKRLDESGPWGLLPGQLPAFRKGSLLERLVSSCIPEVHPITEESLVKNFIGFLETILEGQGWVHMQKGHPKDRASHFETERPNFFNPE